MKARFKSLTLLGWTLSLFVASIYSQSAEPKSQLSIVVKDGNFNISAVVHDSIEKNKVSKIINEALPADRITLNVKTDFSVKGFKGEWEEELAARLNQVKAWKSGMFEFSIDETKVAEQFGKRLSSLSVLTINGDTRIPIVDSSKRATFIYLFATWCVPCFGQLPLLVDLNHQYSDKGVQFIAVDTDDEKSTDIAKFVERFKIDFQVGRASNEATKAITRFSNFNGIPQGILVADGKVKLVILGGGESGNRKLVDLLKELFGSR